LVPYKKKKKKVECEVERLFPDTWATKFPWVELVLEEGNKLHHVRCKIYIVVEYYEKLLVPKLDDLNKHNGRRKCIHSTLE